MPIGIIVDSFAIIIGGLIGSLLGNLLTEKFKDTLRQCFGFIALGIAISLVVNVRNLGAVALSLILGTVIGCLIGLDHYIVSLSKLTLKKSSVDSCNTEDFSTIMILFVFSANNFIGSFLESFEGDSSILLFKAVLDFFTAIIFATKLGKSVSLLAIPQFLVCMICFFIAKPVMPFLVEATIGDFKALSGIIMLMVSLRMLKIVDVKPMDSILGIILVIPISNFWQLIF